MNFPRPPLGRVALAAGAALLVTVASSAAHAEPKARQQAEQLLEELEAHAKSPEVERMVARAKAALQKADDKTLPPAAVSASDGAALQWARAAAEWVKLQQLETQAAEQEQALTELRKKVKHARAQLEETEARRSRASGLLEQHGAGELAPTSSSSAEAPAANASKAAAAKADATHGAPKSTAHGKAAPAKASPQQPAQQGTKQ
jgi:hypothetical protein